MHPESIDGEFGVTVKFIENVDSLYNFTDISHVKHVVRLGGGGQEVFSDSIVEIDGSVCQSL